MAKSRVVSTINVALGRRVALNKVVVGVNAAAEDGASQLVKIYGLPPVRTGNQYSGNPNRSSAPGEAPAPQSGLLKQGVHALPAVIQGQTVSAQVASQGENAAKLELGTEKIEPRPAVSRLQTEEPRRHRLIRVFQLAAARK